MGGITVINPASIVTSMTTSPPQRIREFVRSLGWRRWRQTFLLFLLLTVVTISIGSSATLSKEESSRIQENLEKNLPKNPTPSNIFTNNFTIASIMLIPGLGIIAGAFVLYNTGLAIAATGLSVNLHGVILMLALLLLPFTWLEFISYSAAMTQSIFLTVGLARRQFRRELIRTAILLTLILTMLLSAAIIEILFIKT